MSKQRFVIFLIAIIGMIATFLPWYEMGSLGMIMGYQTVGWFTFVMFALVFLFGLRKGVKQDMSTGLLYLGSFFFTACCFRGLVADHHARIGSGRGKYVGCWQRPG